MEKTCFRLALVSFSFSLAPIRSLQLLLAPLTSSQKSDRPTSNAMGKVCLIIFQAFLQGILKDFCGLFPGWTCEISPMNVGNMDGARYSKTAV